MGPTVFGMQIGYLHVESSSSLDIERMFMAGAGVTVLFGLGGVVQIVRAMNSKEDGQQIAGSVGATHTCWLDLVVQAGPGALRELSRS